MIGYGDNDLTPKMLELIYKVRDIVTKRKLDDFCSRESTVKELVRLLVDINKCSVERHRFVRIDGFRVPTDHGEIMALYRCSRCRTVRLEIPSNDEDPVHSPPNYL